MNDTAFLHRYDELTDLAANLQGHGLSPDQAELTATATATAIGSVRGTADAALNAATRNSYRQDPFALDVFRSWGFRPGEDMIADEVMEPRLVLERVEAQAKGRFDLREVALIAVAAFGLGAMALRLLGAG